MTTAVAPLTETRPAGLIASDDRARIERATEDSRSANTRAQYRSGARAWREWADINGHQPLPATPDAVAAYLAERAEQGAAASTLSAARAAIGASHRDANVDDPTATEPVRRVLKGLRRQAAGRGRGQAQGLTADDCAAVLATADRPRRTGRGTESDEQAAERGATDKVIVSLLFQGGLRRSEAAQLAWADVTDATDGNGVLVTVRRSKTDQEGKRADVRYLKNGCAQALRLLRDRLTVRASGMCPAADALVLGGLNGQSIARRLTAAARAAGIEGRITGHSGRVGLASELTARGASTAETMLAGGWKTERMVAHYSAGATAERGAVAKYL
ncbi:MAG: tyrosine-type recombinase/integrase [Spirochaetaceae bacterium]|nr:tyrosine-type recombinase/integrase [Spirochaetaceae bacterium]